jgi:hypothetical protein
MTIEDLKKNLTNYEKGLVEIEQNIAKWRSLLNERIEQHAGQRGAIAAVKLLIAQETSNNAENPTPTS